MDSTLTDTVFTESDDTYSTDIELENGTYEIYVKARDAEDNEYGTSESVSITIDTEAATLDYVEIGQEGDLTAGGTFEIYVYSEPDLHQVGVLLDDKIYELTESLGTDGTYVGLLVAPGEAGTYSLDIILVDSLANEVQYSDAATITVVADETTTDDDSTDDEDDTDTDTDTETGNDDTTTDGTDDDTSTDDTTDASADTEDDTTTEETAYPSTVTGLEATNGDTKVTLTWEAAIAGSEDTYIDHYKVYYGYAEDLLYSTATTFDSSTTWYIPNLDNDTTYYFAIVAVDSKGVESLEKSSVMSGTPEAEEVSYTMDMGKLHDSADDEDVSIEDTGTPEETPESGPETAWILLFTLVFTQFYFQAKKKIGLMQNE